MTSSDWVPIEEYLPVEGESVLATGWDYDKPGYHRHTVVCQFRSGQFLSEIMEERCEVAEFITHWMPIILPE
jgi:hypothetical protein